MTHLMTWARSSHFFKMFAIARRGLKASRRAASPPARQTSLDLILSPVPDGLAIIFIWHWANFNPKMTTLQPRGPYSQDELKKLYPEGLQLQLVQVLLRHGERSPVSARFQNAGLQPFWPYCAVARQMSSATFAEGKWTAMQWRRRMETFGLDDGPVIASGPKGEVDSVCNLGELTDTGRQTTYDLGRRLRHLYVDQLQYMPPSIDDADMIYLRATPIPRALESLQQTFWGMYPSKNRSDSFPPVTIITRAPADETLCALILPEVEAKAIFS